MDFKQFYKTINFDIDNEIRTVYQATQGDTKSRGLVVDLIVGGVKTPVTTETMNFFALKPDGTRVMTAGVKEGTGFRIDFTNQTFAVPGVLLCTLVLYGTNGEKIADRKFKMTVDSSLEDGAIISEDERGILDRAFDLASDILPRLEALDVTLLENLEQEVITARGTEATLGARLDSTDEQLADIENVQLPGKVAKINELQDAHIIRNLPNGVKDEIKASDNKVVKRIGTYSMPSAHITNVAVTTDGLHYRGRGDGWATTNNALQSTLNSVVGKSIDGNYLSTTQSASGILGTAGTAGKSIGIANNYVYLYVEKAKIDAMVGIDLKAKFQTYLDLYPVMVIYQFASAVDVALPSTMSPNTVEVARLSDLVNKLSSAIIALGGTIV